MRSQLALDAAVDRPLCTVGAFQLIAEVSLAWQRVITVPVGGPSPRPSLLIGASRRTVGVRGCLTNGARNSPRDRRRGLVDEAV